MSAWTHLLQRGPYWGQMELSHTTEAREVIGYHYRICPTGMLLSGGTYGWVVRFPSRGAGNGGTPSILRTRYVLCTVAPGRP